jgi:drug/metabolite transporter (DMT)-like permease
VSGRRGPARRFAPIAVMLVAVSLQIAGAGLLKSLADARARASWLALGAGIAAVVAINVGRLAVWGFAHRRFPLSTVFPLSALFFPALLVLALAFGEPVRAGEVAGALCITAGSAWLAWRAPA